MQHQGEQKSRGTIFLPTDYLVCVFSVPPWKKRRSSGDAFLCFLVQGIMCREAKLSKNTYLHPPSRMLVAVSHADCVRIRSASAGLRVVVIVVPQLCWEVVLGVQASSQLTRSTRWSLQ